MSSLLLMALALKDADSLPLGYGCYVCLARQSLGNAKFSESFNYFLRLPEVFQASLAH